MIIMRMLEKEVCEPDLAFMLMPPSGPPECTSLVMSCHVMSCDATCSGGAGGGAGPGLSDSPGEAGDEPGS